MKRNLQTLILTGMALLAFSATAWAQRGGGFIRTPPNSDPNRENPFMRNPNFPPGQYTGFYYNDPYSGRSFFKGTYNGQPTTIKSGGSNRSGVGPGSGTGDDYPGSPGSTGPGGITPAPGRGVAAPAQRATGDGPRDATQYRNRVEQSEEHGQIRVLLPADDAKVWFEDAPAKQDGAERIFRTPPLEKGKSYIVKVAAAWERDGKEVKKEQKVDVQLGKEALVDFRDEPKPAPKPAPPKE